MRPSSLNLGRIMMHKLSLGTVLPDQLAAAIMQWRIGTSANVARRKHTSARPAIPCHLARYAGTLNLPTVMKALALMLRHILLLWW